MAWENLTLADVRRLVAAIEQAGGNPQTVKAIINRAPADDGEHGRVTLGTLVNLLEQLEGKTVLSDEDLRLIHRPEEPVIVRPTFAELLVACNQDVVDPEFTEANFPLVDDGTYNPVEDLWLHETISLSVAFDRINELGFTPVGLRRAMEWVAVNQNAQLKHPFAVIGATKVKEGNFSVFYCSVNSKRSIVIDHFHSGTTFREDAGILVARK